MSQLHHTYITKLKYFTPYNMNKTIKKILPSSYPWISIDNLANRNKEIIFSASSSFSFSIFHFKTSSKFSSQIFWSVTFLLENTRIYTNSTPTKKILLSPAKNQFFGQRALKLRCVKRYNLSDKCVLKLKLKLSRIKAWLCLNPIKTT